MKTITKNWLEKKGACEEGIEWFINQKIRSTIDLINYFIENKFQLDWGNWLITKCMTKRQNIQYAIFSAELVIKIFEEKYPNDNRPAKAIKAAKEYLKTPSIKNKNAANAATNAAYAAAYAAYAAYGGAYAAANAAYAAYAAYAAANAAYAAYAAANAAAYAAYAAAYAAYAASKKEILIKILKYGLKLKA